MHSQVESAAGGDVKRRYGISKTIGSPPFGEVFRIGPDFPHEFDGCVEGSVDAEFAVGRISVFVFHDVLFLIFLSMLRGSRVSFRNAGGTGRSKPKPLLICRGGLRRSGRGHAG